MTAELLAAAQSGRVRIAIGRASDFFGAGATESSLGARVFGNAVVGKRTDFIGNPNLPHTYSYVPDIAAGLATLGPMSAPPARCAICRAQKRDHAGGPPPGG